MLPILPKWIPTNNQLLRNAEKALLGPRAHAAVDVEIGGGNRIHTLIAGRHDSVKSTSDLIALLKDRKPPIVLCHGFGAGAAYFVHQIDSAQHLAKDREVLAIDWLGNGLSSRPKFPLRSRDPMQRAIDAEKFFVDALEEWRGALKIPKMTLLGHSLGGFCAAAYTFEHSEHVEKLILASPVGVPSAPTNVGVPPSRFFRLAYTLWNRGVTPQRLVRLLGPRGPQLVNRFAAARFAAWISPHGDERELFANYLYHLAAGRASGEHASHTIQAPGAYARRPLSERWHLMPQELKILFMYGVADWMDVRAAQMLCEKNENWQVRTVDDAGHHLLLDNAAQCNELIQQFIADTLPVHHVVKRLVRRRRHHVDNNEFVHV